MNWGEEQHRNTCLASIASRMLAVLLLVHLVMHLADHEILQQRVLILHRYTSVDAFCQMRCLLQKEGILFGQHACVYGD